MTVRAGFAGICGLAVGLAGAGTVLGGTTQYGDRATFQAQLTGIQLFDFETASGFPPAAAPIASFDGGLIESGSTGGPAFIVQYTDATNQAMEGSSILPGSNLPTADAFQPVFLTFKNGQHAVGFDDLDLTQNSESAVMVVNFDGGVASELFSRTDPTGFSNPFIGVISTDTIRSVEIYSTDIGAESTPGLRANLFDNLTLGTPAVPEPGTLVGVGAAMGALILRRRR